MKRFTSSRGIVAAAGLWLAMAAGPSSHARADEVATSHLQARWRAAWDVPQQAPNALEFGTPNWSLPGFSNHSVRQIVRLSTGGALLRIRLSNAHGTAPVRLAGASLARAGQGGAVLPGSLRALTFGLSPGRAVIPDGGELVSDPTYLPTAALERLAVTLYFDQPSGPATFHWFANSTTYRAAGDQRFEATGAPFLETSSSWFFLAGVEVVKLRGPSRDTVVAFGDSITDAAFSTPDADNRYPDDLAERLVVAGQRLAVLNAGIGGNRVLADSPCFGEKATTRFARDALDKPGVRTVIVLEGINDIGSIVEGFDFGDCLQPNPALTAEQLIDGHRELIRAAHARGVRIIGGTITPFKGAIYYSDRGEQIRAQVNDWIRNGGEYDAVIDFDRALRDPADPSKLRAEYDSGDALHPNDAGTRAMAEAIDLDTL